MRAAFAADSGKKEMGPSKYVPFEKIEAKWGKTPLPEIRAAGEKGDPEAQHFLGRGYMQARWGKQDRTERLRFAEQR